jgi:iron complex outermembrane receptor protein
LPAWGKIKDFFISINNLIVSKQSRVPPKSDYVLPPAGYMLWATDIGCSFPVLHQQVNASLSVTNLTNVAYRDYLNRFRYFIDDLGRNISLRIKIPLDFSKQHD